MFKSPACAPTIGIPALPPSSLARPSLAAPGAPCLSLPVRSLSVLALAALLALPAVFAQQPTRTSAHPQPPDNPTPSLVLRESVRRVVVDVVVTDHGKPVPGLTAADFRVFEDGKPQTIRTFEALTPQSGEILPARPPVLPFHTFLNLPPTPQRANTPLTVILFDALNTSLKNQLYARQQMIRFLREMPAGVPTEICVLSDRLHLLQGFSGEREVLLRAARGQKAIPDQLGLLPDTSSDGTGTILSPATEAQMSPGGTGAAPGTIASPGSNFPGVSSNQPAGMPVPVAGPASADVLLAQMSDEIRGYMLDQRVNITLAAFQQLARALSSVPGRKNLIWISGSFPAILPPDESAGPFAFANLRSYHQQIADTDDLLGASQIAVYPVDARGLVAPLLQSGPGTAQAYAAQLAAHEGTESEIAGDTGGTAYFNVNDLARVFQSALDNGTHYYSLSYAPTNSNFNGKLRRIRLEVDRKGCKLAYRRTYYAVDFSQPRTASDAQAVAAAQPGSIMSALEFGAPQARDLVFAARVNALGPPKPATRNQMRTLIPFFRMAANTDGVNFSKPRQPLPLERYLVQYAVMARELQLPQGNDGSVHPRLSFAAMAYDAQGNPLGGSQTTLDTAIPTSKIPDLQKIGFQATLNLFVPLNASSLRIAVRDDRGSRIGSLLVPLPLATPAK